MKNPFAILLTAAVIIGILIAAVAILVLGPSDDASEETVPVASQSDLPTPSTRNEALSRETAQPTPTAEPTKSPEVSSTQDEPTEPEAETQTTTITDPATESVQGAPATRAGRGDRFDGAGPGAANFQAIQEAIAENPEIAELMQKAQSGNITQQDQARMQELMQELLAEAGIEVPGGGQGRGFGAPPTQGTISAISGSTVTIDHNDDSGLSTDIEVTDDTNINVITQLTPDDLAVGTNVAGTVQRGEGGRIFILNLAIIPDQQGQGGGFGRGFGGGIGAFLGAAGPENNDLTNISNINGTIAEINDSQISVETTQGTLRLSTNEASTIISISTGTLTDITQGMAAIALGANPPNNLTIGPESLLR